MNIVLGLASTPDCGGNLARCQAALNDLAGQLGFQLVVSQVALMERADAEAAARQFADQQADFVLVLCNSFTPNGDVVLPFGDLMSRLGLWALPEPTRQGQLQLTSLVALNLFSSMLHRFAHGDLPRFKWFEGDVDDPSFVNRLRTTVGALRVIKGLQGASIGYIGGHAPGFVNLQFNPQLLEDRLGIRVSSLPIEAVLEEARKITSREAKEWGERLASRATLVTCSPSDLSATSRIALALETLRVERGFSAMAVSCWPRFHQDLGVFPCVAYGTLNDAGTIVACEGDVLGAVSLLVLSLAGSERPALMDLVSLLDKEDAACFWHCGLATWSLADAQGVRLITRPTGASDGTTCQTGGFADVTFAPGPVTVARVSDSAARMLIASGQVTDRLGPGYEGSGGWVDRLQMLHQPVSPSQLFDAVARYGVEHHYAILPEDVSDILLEFAAWLRLDIVRPGQVHPHLSQENDPCC